jgi:hypothetical protein
MMNHALVSRALAAGGLIVALSFAPGALARGGSHGGGHSGHAGSRAFAHAGGHRSHSSYRGHSRSRHASSSTRSSRAYAGVKRDGHGHIARDPHAREAFRSTHRCPSTGKTYGSCPGWVVDHVQALKHGGADAPWNMQWQTRAAAKAKDRWE